ncbi:MAG: cation diffusion facilitator family transporter [Propionibacteriaceae bacterium]
MTASATPETADSAAPAKPDSLVTVLVAFGANLLIAIAKTIAAVMTGSASLVAEAAHSWADAGNEIFLLIADRRSGRRRDLSHPLGYGREAYVWSMFAAFGLFSAGAIVSIWHGFTELLDPEPATNYPIAYIVLAIAFVLEGVSFLQALRQTRKAAESLNRQPIWHILNTSNPTLRAVFFEDSAALVGLIIAGAGVGLHQLTGSPTPDAIGSILVGLLLGVVAVVLIDRNRRFLVGEEVDPVVRGAVLTGLIQHREIDRVTYLHLEFVGPGRMYLVAAIDMTGDEAEHDLAVRLRRVERELEKNDNVEEAVLTLSTADEKSLLPPEPAGA